MFRSSSNWTPINIIDFTDEIKFELDQENPNAKIIREWRNSVFSRQTGISVENAGEDAKREFFGWAHFQREHAEVDVIYRRWPRLEHLLFESYTDKVLTLAQRHCFICAGGRPVEDLFPVSVIPIRLAPRSRQVMDRTTWTAFQAALAHRLSQSPQIDLGVTGRLCVAITFVLSDLGRDKDLDNMVKALQDGIARAIGFNDAHIYHLDVIKVIFPASEEFVVLRIAPSALNEHDDVCIKAENQSWAGATALKLENFFP